MASEAFAWPEGSIWLWTGAAGAVSAVPGYATDTTMSEQHGAENLQNVSGVYRDVPTGRRVDVNIGAIYCADISALQTFASAETAVHMHMKHAIGTVSAGRFMWSGYIDQLDIVGRERDVYRVRLSFHANRWSAY